MDWFVLVLSAMAGVSGPLSILVSHPAAGWPGPAHRVLGSRLQEWPEDSPTMRSVLSRFLSISHLLLVGPLAKARHMLKPSLCKRDYLRVCSQGDLNKSGPLL